MKLAQKILIGLLALSAGLAVAQVYKWKDANGNMHYSDTPPAPGQAKPEVVNTVNMPVSSIVTAKAPAIVATAKPSASEVASAVAAKKAQQDPRLCQQAQARKTFLLSGQLSKAVNEKGEVEYMSESQRAAELQEVEKAIKQFCL